MKINPILDKKILGLTVNYILGILCAVICADAFDASTSIEEGWLRWGLWMLFWIIGFVAYTIIIALIKTYITKED